MTGKERVLTVLRGGVPDRVPFAPNIGQWFDCHRHRGTLPPELGDCQDELEAMLKLECDIFSRRLGSFFQAERSGSVKRAGSSRSEAVFGRPGRRARPPGSQGQPPGAGQPL